MTMTACPKSFTWEISPSIPNKLVLQNVFNKNFLTAYFSNFTNYINSINAINSGRISADGRTSNGENFYMHMIDDLRWEVVLPREFAHPALLTNPRVMEVLMDDVILGYDLSLHSLGTALAEPGANAQGWHGDANYLFMDSSLQTKGIAGHDLPAYSITMMVPLLNITVSFFASEKLLSFFFAPVATVWTLKFSRVCPERV